MVPNGPPEAWPAHSVDGVVDLLAEGCSRFEADQHDCVEVRPID